MEDVAIFASTGLRAFDVRVPLALNSSVTWRHALSLRLSFSSHGEQISDAYLWKQTTIMWPFLSLVSKKLLLWILMSQTTEFTGLIYHWRSAKKLEVLVQGLKSASGISQRLTPADCWEVLSVNFSMLCFFFSFFFPSFNIEELTEEVRESSWLKSGG